MSRATPPNRRISTVPRVETLWMPWVTASRSGAATKMTRSRAVVGYPPSSLKMVLLGTPLVALCAHTARPLASHHSPPGVPSPWAFPPADVLQTA